jgi:hypothetical protein
MIPLAIKSLPWRYIAPALAVLALLFAVYGAGVKHERARWKPRVDLAIRERDAARGNVTALQQAIQARNAAIELEAGKTRAAQDKAAVAVRKAQERERALAGMRGKLANAARSVPTEAGCAVQPVARDMWKVL